jgi:hypothetical protein
MGDGGEVLAENGKRLRHEHPLAVYDIASGNGIHRNWFYSCQFVHIRGQTVFIPCFPRIPW